MKKWILVMGLFWLGLSSQAFSADLEIVDVKYKLRTVYDDYPSIASDEKSFDSYVEIAPLINQLQLVVLIRNNSNQFKELFCRYKIINLFHNRLISGRNIKVTIKDSIENFWDYQFCEYYDTLNNLIKPPFEKNGWSLPPKSSIKITISPFEANGLFEFHHGRMALKIYIAEYSDSINLNDSTF